MWHISDHLPISLLTSVTYDMSLICDRCQQYWHLSHIEWQMSVTDVSNDTDICHIYVASSNIYDMTYMICHISSRLSCVTYWYTIYVRASLWYWDVGCVQYVTHDDLEDMWHITTYVTDISDDVPYPVSQAHHHWDLSHMWHITTYVTDISDDVPAILLCQICSS